MYPFIAPWWILNNAVKYLFQNSKISFTSTNYYWFRSIIFSYKRSNSFFFTRIRFPIANEKTVIKHKWRLDPAEISELGDLNCQTKIVGHILHTDITCFQLYSKSLCVFYQMANTETNKAFTNQPEIRVSWPSKSISKYVYT